ncbi:unnamed protein product [Closterium sp. Yama58-4]|nr:unnamed protein product [Closterium sp. Yama58-4]
MAPFRCAPPVSSLVSSPFRPALPSLLAGASEISGSSDEAATAAVDLLASVLAQVSSGKTCCDRPGGVHPSIFINPATFHLTVQMLKLWSPLRVQAAANALQAVMPRVQEVLGDAPLVIRLVGLRCMRGHPSKAHVLYADMEEVDGGTRLPAVCEVLREACREAGLVTPRDCRQPLKASFACPVPPTPPPPTFPLLALPPPSPHRNARVPFDASLIVAQHGDTEWGEVRLGEVHLSQRFKFDDQGYYHCCSSLPLP